MSDLYNPFPKRGNRGITLVYNDENDNNIYLSVQEENNIEIFVENHDDILKDLPKYEDRPQLYKLEDRLKDDITLEQHVDLVRDDLMILLVMRHTYIDKNDQIKELEESVNDFYDLLHAMTEILNIRNMN